MRRAVSSERTADERGVATFDLQAPRSQQRKHGALHDDDGGQGDHEHDRRPQEKPRQRLGVERCSPHVSVERCEQQHRGHPWFESSRPKTAASAQPYGRLHGILARPLCGPHPIKRLTTLSRAVEPRTNNHLSRQRHSLRTVSLFLLACLLAVPLCAAGQDDILTKARAAATSGRRAEALSMLESHLSEAPRDVDARLLYGLVLSWEGRYEEARPVLQQVLTQAPTYTDARVALMNVEYWSGDSAAALEAANLILASQPGDPTARAVRDRIEAANRPWSAGFTFGLDTFDDGTDPWQEAAASLTRRTAVGSLIMRWSHAERFGFRDDFFDTEFYPRFRPGTYALAGFGVAPKSAPSLYPR
ncbi:MAG TPA: tetratricopeptide repeat protein, partial [Polyangiaceae bacterium]|nr:tetratricopeptide repeat protein [Polyangiaceae bacterium]